MLQPDVDAQQKTAELLASFPLFPRPTFFRVSLGRVFEHRWLITTEKFDRFLHCLSSDFLRNFFPVDFFLLAFNYLCRDGLLGCLRTLACIIKTVRLDNRLTREVVD